MPEQDKRGGPGKEFKDTFGREFRNLNKPKGQGEFARNFPTPPKSVTAENYEDWVNGYFSAKAEAKAPKREYLERQEIAYLTGAITYLENQIALERLSKDASFEEVFAKIENEIEGFVAENKNKKTKTQGRADYEKPYNSELLSACKALVDLKDGGFKKENLEQILKELRYRLSLIKKASNKLSEAE